MEPLFENRLTVDKDVLWEWYKAEYDRGTEHSTPLAVVAAVAYLVLAATVMVLASALGSTLIWVLGGAFILLAALFVGLLILRPRMQLKALVRKNKDELHEQLVLFYPNGALPLTGAAAKDGAAAVARVARFAQNAQALQGEFEQTLHNAQLLKEADAGQLDALRDELGDLQQRMDGLSQAAGELNALGRCAYAKATDYLRTDNLFIIHYDERVLLVGRDGFEKGSARAFADFMEEKLAFLEEKKRAEAAAKRQKRKKKTDKAEAQAEGENNDESL